MRNPQYWDDLMNEGRGLTQEAEGQARDLRVPRHPDDRSRIHDVAQQWRDSIKDKRHRERERPEHQLQDVIDAYRSLHPHASRVIGPRGEPRN